MNELSKERVVFEGASPEVPTAVNQRPVQTDNTEVTPEQVGITGKQLADFEDGKHPFLDKYPDDMDYIDRARAEAGVGASAWDRAKELPEEVARGVLRTIRDLRSEDEETQVEAVTQLLGATYLGRAPVSAAKSVDPNTVSAVGASVPKGRPLFHGTGTSYNPEIAARSILKDGFKIGSSSELNVSGTSLATNPTVSTVKFMGRPSVDPEKNALIVANLPKNTEVYNLDPAEYLTMLLNDGRSLESIKNDMVVGTPRSYYDETEVFVPETMRQRIEVREPTPKEVKSLTDDLRNQKVFQTVLKNSRTETDVLRAYIMHSDKARSTILDKLRPDGMAARELGYDISSMATALLGKEGGKKLSNKYARLNIAISRYEESRDRLKLYPDGERERKSFNKNYAIVRQSINEFVDELIHVKNNATINTPLKRDAARLTKASRMENKESIEKITKYAKDRLRYVDRLIELQRTIGKAPTDEMIMLQRALKELADNPKTLEYQQDFLESISVAHTFEGGYLTHKTLEDLYRLTGTGVDVKGGKIPTESSVPKKQDI